MGQLDASIVAVAFPDMSRSLHAPVAAVEWVALAYMVTLVALLAAVGRVSDAVGRKLIYVYGFAVFTAASAACGLAPGLGWLVACRVVQAVGAAMLQANSIALITTTVAGRDRSVPWVCRRRRSRSGWRWAQRWAGCW
jgi:MFS family permease